MSRNCLFCVCLFNNSNSSLLCLFHATWLAGKKFYTLINSLSRNLGTIFLLPASYLCNNVYKNKILIKVGIIRNESLFLWILLMCKLWRVTHKLSKALWALFSLWVIRQSLHKALWALFSLWVIRQSLHKALWALFSLWVIRQSLHKALWALFSLWVIRQSLHTDKIHKNKIHSYNVQPMVQDCFSCGEKKKYIISQNS